MNFSYYTSLFVILSICFSISEQLDCTQIPLNTQVAGKNLYIPDNQNTPVTLPVNFNCTYAVNPPTQVYAQITVSNNLKGVDDVIVVTDGQKTVTKITRNNSTDVVFYVFPGTSTLVNVQNFDATSKFQMTISYVQLPNPEQRALQKGQSLNYLMLDSIQRKPITLSADGPITLTLARSSYKSDEFDNYFVVDGFLDQPKTVKRLVDFTLTNFKASSNLITLVGLDDKVSHSSVFLNPSTDLNGYDHFSGVTVDKLTGNIVAHVDQGQKVGVMIVAKDAGQLVLNKLSLGDSADCKCTAVTGPPTADSKTLINFKEDQYALPQLFPYPYFSFIVENCNIQFNFTTTVFPSYYQLDGERSGFIFSPNYFNSEATNGFINLTFAYTGADRKQFVVDVDRAMLSGSTSSEMDINIYDSDWKKTLSTVITGNQEGTRSRAYGSYLNVQMTGYVDGKLKWRLGSTGVSIFNVQSMLILTVLYLVISF
ncbi:hypothetical protein B9Z55_013637 [Caenorhabditis nigoni]|uniref:CUB-like domain-containing protein n=1 Tax=Caenorhabditis nigoni TaxID=1611254 RepID=A0A2G5U2K7_9PELO|nr:hypothetical protein B9Z55_013637 [Caenorhabditis nigoni]